MGLSDLEQVVKCPQTENSEFTIIKIEQFDKKKCRKAEQAACKDPPKDIHGGGEVCTHNVTQQTDTHTRGGGRTNSVIKRTDTQGGTHPQCNPTNGQTYFHRGGDAPTM